MRLATKSSARSNTRRSSASTLITMMMAAAAVASTTVQLLSLSLTLTRSTTKVLSFSFLGRQTATTRYQRYFCASRPSIPISSYCSSSSLSSLSNMGGGIPTARRALQRGGIVALSSSSDKVGRDDYDDFFNDFDPSEYAHLDKDYNTNNNFIGNDNGSSPARGRETNGRRSYGGGGAGAGGRSDRDRGRGQQGRQEGRRDSYRGGGGGGRSSGSRDFGRGRRIDNDFDDGRGHDYVRDVDADASKVDVPTIDKLLAERLQARKTGRFDEADDIRDVLLDEHGVLVRDKDKVWRSGASRSGSGQKWTTSPTANNRRQDDRGRPRNQRDGYKGGDPFGTGPPIDPETGHDYSLAPDAGPIIGDITEKEIHALLAERLSCKLARDFRRADDIQAELVAMNVLVNDSQKLWRADGQSFGSKFTPKQYVESDFSEGVSSPQVAQEIEKLIAQRSLAKAERLFKRADALRDELLIVHNVAVDDKLQEWSVGGNFGATTVSSDSTKFEQYKCASWSTVPDDADEIQRLVEEREIARVKRQFDVADSIREELRDRSIVIDDRKREWYDSSTIGESREFGMDSTSSFSQPEDKAFPPYRRRGGGGEDLTEEDFQTIENLMMKRDEHKKLRQFRSADEIRDRLRSDYDIRVDDVNREWHVFSDSYHMSAGTVVDDDELRSYIQQKVEERSAARLAKNFDLADDIRYDLENDYGVVIDDRVREWYVKDGQLVSDDADLVWESETEAEDEIDNYDDEDDEEGESDEAAASSESSSAAAEGVVDLTSLTVPELKDLLREKGLKISGKKSELIDRLIES